MAAQHFEVCHLARKPDESTFAKGQLTDSCLDGEDQLHHRSLLGPLSPELNGGHAVCQAASSDCWRASSERRIGLFCRLQQP